MFLETDFLHLTLLGRAFPALIFCLRLAADRFSSVLPPHLSPFPAQSVDARPRRFEGRSSGTQDTSLAQPPVRGYGSPDEYRSGATSAQNATHTPRTPFCQ